MRISDWSSDVCSSDLGLALHPRRRKLGARQHFRSVSVRLGELVRCPDRPFLEGKPAVAIHIELGERLAAARKIFLAGDRLVAVLVIAVEAALLALLLARLRRGGRRGGDPFARCGRRSWRDDAVARARAFIAPEQHRKHSQGQRKRSEEHTSELQSLMRISYAGFCLKK